MERTEALTQAAAPARTLEGSYVDWAAVLGGAVVASATGALFTAFGAALGLSSISAEPGNGSFGFAVILSGLWLVLTLVASYWTGGYIAGRMRRRVDQAKADEVTAHDGLNGLVVWGVGTLIGLMVLTSAVSSTVAAAGSAAGTAVSAAGSLAGGLVQGAASAAGGMVPDEVKEDPTGFVSDTLLRPAQVDPATATDAADVARQTSGILANAVKTGEVSDADRAWLQTAVAARTGLTADEAGARVDAAVKTALDLRAGAEKTAADARQAAIDAAETARKAAILSAFAIAAASLIAAAAAYVGAVRGGQHRDEGRIFGGFAYRR